MNNSVTLALVIYDNFSMETAHNENDRNRMTPKYSYIYRMCIVYVTYRLLELPSLRILYLTLGTLFIIKTLLLLQMRIIAS